MRFSVIFTTNVSTTDEIDRLSRELQNTTDELTKTQGLHNQSLEEIELLVARERELQERDTRVQQSRDELERELDAKEDLVKFFFKRG